MMNSFLCYLILFKSVDHTSQIIISDTISVGDEPRILRTNLLLFHNMEVLEIFKKGAYIPTLFVSNEKSNNKRDKRDWESKIDLSKPTSL